MSEHLINPSLGPASRSFLFSPFVNYKFFKKLSESIKNVWQNSRLRVTRPFFCHLAPFYDYFVPFLFIFFSMHFIGGQRGLSMFLHPLYVDPIVERISCSLFMPKFFLFRTEKDPSLYGWCYACYRNPKNPTCIDLIMRNKSKLYHNRNWIFWIFLPKETEP